jgi:hypothetical protein
MSFLKVTSCSTTQGFRQVLIESEGSLSVHKSPPLVPIIIQMNPGDTTPFSFPKFHFNIIIPKGSPPPPFHTGHFTRSVHSRGYQKTTQTAPKCHMRIKVPYSHFLHELFVLLIFWKLRRHESADGYRLPVNNINMATSQLLEVHKSLTLPKASLLHYLCGTTFLRSR